MGHSTVNCAKTTEPVEVPFWTKTRVGLRNQLLNGGADPLRGRTILAGCPKRSIALAILLQPSHRGHVRYKRDHSIANNVMQQKGSFCMSGKRK